MQEWSLQYFPQLNASWVNLLWSKECPSTTFRIKAIFYLLLTVMIGRMLCFPLSFTSQYSGRFVNEWTGSSVGGKWRETADQKREVPGKEEERGAVVSIAVTHLHTVYSYKLNSFIAKNACSRVYHHHPASHHLRFEIVSMGEGLGTRLLLTLLLFVIQASSSISLLSFLIPLFTGLISRPYIIYYLL